MSQSLAKIYTHIIFSTKSRHPFLRDMGIRTELHSYLAGACKVLRSPAIIVGGVADHVHLLCILSKNLSAAELLREIKRASSQWIKSKGFAMKKFTWQEGYAVFSVSQSHVEAVRSYISSQQEHHRKKSFQEEVMLLLKKYRVEFDNNHLWD